MESGDYVEEACLGKKNGGMCGVHLEGCEYDSALLDMVDFSCNEAHAMCSKTHGQR